MKYHLPHTVRTLKILSNRKKNNAKFVLKNKNIMLNYMLVQIINSAQSKFKILHTVE